MTFGTASRLANKRRWSPASARSLLPCASETTRDMRDDERQSFARTQGAALDTTPSCSRRHRGSVRHRAACRNQIPVLRRDAPERVGRAASDRCRVGHFMVLIDRELLFRGRLWPNHGRFRGGAGFSWLGGEMGRHDFVVSRSVATPARLIPVGAQQTPMHLRE